MVQQLLPDVHLNFRNIQVNQFPGLHGFLGHEIRQEGYAHTLLHQIANQVGIADFQHGNDFQRLLGQLLIQQTAVAHALFRENEGVLHQLPGGNLNQACQGRGGGRHKMVLHLFLPDDDVFGVVDVAFQGENGIHFVMIQQTEHLFRTCGYDFQADTGVGLEKLLEIVLQQGIAQGIRHGHPDADGAGAVRLDVLLQLGGQLIDLVGVGQHFPALFRKHDSAVDALEERKFQFLLQLADLKGNGGLGAAQGHAGFCKAAQLRYMDKGGQVFQVHFFTSKKRGKK